MSRLREFKHNPFSYLGALFGLASFALILLLFLMNSIIGSMGRITELLLYYTVPLFLILSILFFIIDKIRKRSSRRKHHKHKRSGKPGIA